MSVCCIQGNRLCHVWRCRKISRYITLAQSVHITCLQVSCSCQADLVCLVKTHDMQVPSNSFSPAHIGKTPGVPTVVLDLECHQKVMTWNFRIDTPKTTIPFTRDLTLPSKLTQQEITFLGVSLSEIPNHARKIYRKRRSRSSIVKRMYGSHLRIQVLLFM